MMQLRRHPRHLGRAAATTTTLLVWGADTKAVYAGAPLAMVAVKLRTESALNHSIWPLLKVWAKGDPYKHEKSASTRKLE